MEFQKSLEGGDWMMKYINKCINIFLCYNSILGKENENNYKNDNIDIVHTFTFTHYRSFTPYPSISYQR